MLARKIVRADAMPVRAIPTSRVYRVVCDDGSAFAVKEGLEPLAPPDGPPDLLSTEWRLLSLLSAHGLPVARPAAFDMDARCLITHWVSGPTVDQACQSAAGVGPSTAADCLDGLRAIEAACFRHADELLPHITPADAAETTDEFAASFARAREAYYVCLDTARPLARDVVENCDVAWEALWEALSAAPTTLGPLDTNARNLILSEDGPVFLDLSGVGWDWPERRAVQYLTSLGRMPGGRVASALSRAAMHTVSPSRGVHAHSPHPSLRPSDTASPSRCGDVPNPHPSLPPGKGEGIRSGRRTGARADSVDGRHPTMDSTNGWHGYDGETDTGAAQRLEGHALLAACLAIAGMLERRDGEWPRWPNASDRRPRSARRLLATGQITPYEPTELLRAEVARAWGG